MGVCEYSEITTATVGSDVGSLCRCGSVVTAEAGGPGGGGEEGGARGEHHTSAKFGAVWRCGSVCCSLPRRAAGRRSNQN